MKHISFSIFLLAATQLAFASHAPKQCVPAKLYVGVFGGSGSSNHFDISQFGTVFFTEAQGGPLSVNAFGQVNNKKTSFFGAQLGYQAKGIGFSSCSRWTLGPAAELEGYAINKHAFNGILFNNTARLAEHAFVVSYPIKKTVFLANAVLSLNSPCCLVHPYIGFGIGNAIIDISGASATQVSPPEDGINHYNTSPSDSSSTFAGQIKLGLSYDLNQYLSVFAEYRGLYLASTCFVLGSSIDPGHAETTSWQVKLNAQRYNLGNVGLRFVW